MKKTLLYLIVIALFGILHSCNTVKPLETHPMSGGSETLFEYKWNLIELNGRPIREVQVDTAHLLFYPGQISRVSGSGGCNRLNGTFELSLVHKIKFSPLATTRMACPGQDESKFINALSQVDNWNIINNQLVLNKGKTLLVKLQGVSAAQSN